MIYEHAPSIIGARNGAPETSQISSMLCTLTFQRNRDAGNSSLRQCQYTKSFKMRDRALIDEIMDGYWHCPRVWSQRHALECMSSELKFLGSRTSKRNNKNLEETSKETSMMLDVNLNLLTAQREMHRSSL